MQRYYGIDLVDIWRGTLSPRRVWQLAEFLPPDSALAESIGGTLQQREWTIEARLLAAIFNALRVADSNNVRLGGGKVKSPKLIDIPEPRPARTRKLDLAALPLARKLGGE